MIQASVALLIKMGFDINIELVLCMCKETGKPYYHSGKGFERIYGIPALEVPAHLKRYLQERGSIFYAYTEHFNEDERYNVYVEDFLEHYPSWDAVQEHSCYENWWTEDDHDIFKELLEWCMDQDVTFRITWSY